jgi:glycine cleavage system H protein
MEIIEGLLYTKEHEWVKVEGNNAYIGITDYAQNSLGDIVFVELPEIDSEIGREEVLGVIESVKAASDIYSPVSGKVIEINDELEDTPEILNENPYKMWIAVLELTDKDEIKDLMSSKEYETFCDEE